MSISAVNVDSAPTDDSAAGSPVKYRFRITLEGVMLLVVILLIGFAAWHSGTNLLYLIFAILIAFYLLHGAILYLNLRKLEASAGFPETVVVGQPFDVTVAVTNKKRMGAAYAIRLSHQAGDVRSAPFGNAYFPVVAKNGTEERFYSAVLPRRGYHVISSALICTRYPFGFEERTVVHKVNQRILALPATFPVSSVLADIPFGFGDQESHVRGAGTDLYGLREYVPGEHARNVHWRTSARAQKIMIAEYSRDERRQVVLYLNNGVDEEWQTAVRDQFENAITLTASLTRHMLNAGYEVGLKTADGDVAIAQGPTQMLLILRHLATLELTSHGGMLPRSDRVLQVAFHSNDQNPPAGVSWPVIDSRNWHPQAGMMHGEKSS